MVNCCTCAAGLGWELLGSFMLSCIYCALWIFLLECCVTRKARPVFRTQDWQLQQLDSAVFKGWDPKSPHEFMRVVRSIMDPQFFDPPGDLEGIRFTSWSGPLPFNHHMLLPSTIHHLEKLHAPILLAHPNREWLGEGICVVVVFTKRWGHHNPTPEEQSDVYQLRDTQDLGHALVESLWQMNHMKSQ